MPRIIAIVQARMSSQRLPGKSLRPLLGTPMLKYLLDSLSRSEALAAVVVATSQDESDDALASFCAAEGVACSRGSLCDVAGRFLPVLESHRPDAFVRICGDSPLLDHRIVDQAVAHYLAGGYDLVTNVLERTFPKGQSVEVVSSPAFRDSYPLFTLQQQHEHVTRYFYDHPDDFRILNFTSGGEFAQLQLSVDTEQDFQNVERILRSLPRPHHRATWLDAARIAEATGAGA